VMHMLLTQRHPFWRGTGFATMQAIASEKPADPRVLRPDLSDEVTAIIERALRADREQRFASAAEMGAALSRALERLAPGPADRDVAAFMASLFSDQDAPPGRIILPPTAHMTPTQALPDRPSRQMRMVLDQPVESEPVAPPQALEPPDPRALGRQRRMQLTVSGTAIFAALTALLITHVASGRREARRVVTVSIPATAPERSPSPAPDRPLEIVTAPVEAPMAPAQIMEPAAVDVAEAEAEDEEDALDGRGAAGGASRSALERRRLKSAIQSARPRLAACLRRHAGDLPPKSRKVTVGLVVAGTGKVVSVKTTPPGKTALVSCLEGAAGRLRFPRHAQRRIGLAFPVNRHR
jgi:hypothetical protein